MIGGPTPIPYGLLFGGEKFMFFSLFLNANTVGEVRYGLACSDIISSTNAATPLIPLTIYTLLGNTDELFQPTFTIPPILTPVIQDPIPVTRSKLKKFVTITVCMRDFKRGATNLTFFYSRETPFSKSATAEALYPGLFYSTVNLVPSNLIPLLLVP